jgi:hypothetical protein
MQLFISWSGERSKAIASAIRDWLPLIIQSVKPWFSPEDIDKGARWLGDLNTQLEKQSVAVICVTPESLNAPWLLFEVGALSKALESSWVCPVLYGMEPTDVQGPLAQFQATRTTKDDMRRLLSTVNRRLEAQLADLQLDTLHDLLWPQFAEKLDAVSKITSGHRPPHRQTPELLNEMLVRIRAIERQVTDTKSREDSLRRRALLSRSGSGDRIEELKERLAFVTRRIEESEQGRLSIETAIEGLGDDDAKKKGELLAQRDHHLARHAMHRREFEALGDAYAAMRKELESLPHFK